MAISYHDIDTNVLKSARVTQHPVDRLTEYLAAPRQSHQKLDQLLAQEPQHKAPTQGQLLTAQHPVLQQILRLKQCQFVSESH